MSQTCPKISYGSNIKNFQNSSFFGTPYTVCLLILRGTDQALSRSPDVKAFNLVFSAAFKFVGHAAIHLSFSYISTLNLVCSERFLFVALPVLGYPDMREQCKWCPEKRKDLSKSNHQNSILVPSTRECGKYGNSFMTFITSFNILNNLSIEFKIYTKQILHNKLSSGKFPLSTKL